MAVSGRAKRDAGGWRSRAAIGGSGRRSNDANCPRLALPAEGEFRETSAGVQRHGEGSYSDGAETYTGSWESDEMHGRGEYRSATGATFVVRRQPSEARVPVAPVAGSGAHPGPSCWPGGACPSRAAGLGPTPLRRRPAPPPVPPLSSQIQRPPPEASVFRLKPVSSRDSTPVPCTRTPSRRAS